MRKVYLIMTSLEFLIVFGKTIFGYFFVFLVLKIMGKREVGEISTFDIVVFMVISEIFSVSIFEINIPLIYSIVPVCIIVILQIITATLSLKSKKIRKVMEGKPTYLIVNGLINQEELKKNRYNLDNLLMQLRQKDVQTPSECAFALLESNGTLTIIKKSERLLLFPEPIISEGEINYDALEKSGLDKKTLLIEMAKAGYEDENNIFLCEILIDGTFIFIKKEWFSYMITISYNRN